MAESSTSFSSITPSPPRVTCITHNVFELPTDTDEPIIFTVPAGYMLYVGEIAPASNLGNPGDWYIYGTTGGIYRKLSPVSWSLIQTWGSGGGGGTGTVTSVGLDMPNIFTVSSSPVTSSGTIDVQLNAQAANTFLSGPTGGAIATPTFRTLGLSDVPFLGTMAVQDKDNVDIEGGFILDVTITAGSIVGAAISNGTIGGATITAGTINQTAIGQTVPAAGAFTTLSTSGKAITLGGNFTTSGAFTTTLTVTGNTNVTLPTSGTLLTAAGAVTSLSGTANEIGVSVAVGAVNLYLPSALTFTSKTITGGTFNSGAFNGTLGASAPSSAIVTTIASNSLANRRTSKVNFAVTVNVKDYGATGDGSTDDYSAINDAVSALTSRSVLYFPAGRYRTTGGWTVDSKAYITITGDGAEIYNDSGSSGGNTLVINATCSHVAIRNLVFTGSSSVRGNGIHIRLYSDNSEISGCEFSGCSDFAVHTGRGDGYTSNVRITNNFFGASLGDGVHVGGATNIIIADNVFAGTGDDAIGIVADNVSFQPNRVTITGNNIYNAGGAGVSGCGIRVAEGVDISITGNTVHTSQEAGIFVGRYLSTTAYNARIFIANNKLVYTNTIAGMLAAISLNFANDVTVENNKLEAPSNGGGVSFLDCNNLTIQNNLIKTCPGRGIGGDDGTTTNVASNWNRLYILNNTVDDCGTSGSGTEAYYISTSSGRTISNVILNGNNASNTPAGDYVFTNRLATSAKIVNSVSLEGRSISNGGSGLSPTLVNNN